MRLDWKVLEKKNGGIEAGVGGEGDRGDHNHVVVVPMRLRGGHQPLCWRSFWLGPHFQHPRLGC